MPPESTSWDFLLWLSIVGGVSTAALVFLTLLIWFRHFRELPKLPIKEKIEALKSERSDLQTEKAELQREKEGCREALQEAQNTIREAEDSKAWLDQNRGELEKMQERRGELEDVLRQIQSGQAAYDDLKTKEFELKKDLAVATTELAERKAALAGADRLRDEYAELQVSVPQLRAELGSLKAEKEQLGAQCEKLQDKVEKATERHSQLVGDNAAMKTELGHLKDLKDSYLQHLETLKTDIVNEGGTLAGSDPCEDLWQPVFEGSQTGGPASERVRLGGVEQSLKDAKIKLHPRTIRAFHTTLKIQDISPLTVLAGVSGTGKSLLPNVYARTMGINFLQLPVQPGWSSPQDLFGFYNYIEQKYKATEFARSLVQFDQFNDFPDVRQLTGQVLLVLLDEMNLARVEYYFSEMLSRLETRRSIDMGDPEERKKVAVPLGVRYVRADEDKVDVALNMGSNLLFAGTMNEDESTLSLSDKVLDRASVMRFGKPTQFAHEQPEADQIQASPMLRMDVWQSWRGQTQQAPDKYCRMVDELGKVMDEAGSPFGHRVGQAMLEYVAQYPGDKEDAMADQIELKMLPKLRGKDLDRIQMSIGKMKILADDLGDADLEQAIAKGEMGDHGEDVFIWSGLDRSKPDGD